MRAAEEYLQRAGHQRTYRKSSVLVMLKRKEAVEKAEREDVIRQKLKQVSKFTKKIKKLNATRKPNKSLNESVSKRKKNK